MSVAIKKLAPALTALALITAASIVGAATASASVIGTGFGTGTTAAAAEHAAQLDLLSNYRVCHLPPEFYVDGSGRSWHAEAVASCLDTS